MKETVKTTGFILIVLSLTVVAISYTWQSVQNLDIKEKRLSVEQEKLDVEKEKLDIASKNYRLESCINGGRYIYGLGNKPFSGWSEWWIGRWNFEREECEKEEAKYGARSIKIE